MSSLIPPGCDGEATTEDPKTGERVPTPGYEGHHRDGGAGELPVDAKAERVADSVSSA